MSPPLESTRPFGIDRTELVALASTWRRSGRVLANLDVDELENAVGTAASMSAVRAAAEPSQRVAIGIANRLDVLSQIVDRFGAAAAADDQAAGQALRGLADR